MMSLHVRNCALSILAMVAGLLLHSGAANAQVSPEELLEGRGLSKQGTCYVVAGEAEIRREIARIWPVYGSVEAAWNKLAAVQNQEDYVAGLEMEVIDRDTRIGNLDVELGNVPLTRAGDLARFVLRDQRQKTQSEKNTIVGEIKKARKLLPSAEEKQTLWKDFLKSRTEFLEASNGIDSSIKKVADQYKKLLDDAAVSNALRSLFDKKKVRHTLGPSKELRATIDRLRSAERMVSPESA